MNDHPNSSSYVAHIGQNSAVLVITSGVTSHVQVRYYASNVLVPVVSSMCTGTNHVSPFGNNHVMYNSPSVCSTGFTQQNAGYTFASAPISMMLLGLYGGHRGIPAVPQLGVRDNNQQQSTVQSTPFGMMSAPQGAVPLPQVLQHQAKAHCSLTTAVNTPTLVVNRPTIIVMTGKTLAEQINQMMVHPPVRSVTRILPNRLLPFLWPHISIDTVCL